MSIDRQTLPDAYGLRLRRNGLAAGTVTKYVAAARHYLDWLGERDPTSQRRADLERYLDHWHATETPKPATVRVRIAALKKLFDYLDSTGDMVDGDGRELANPVDRIERPRSRRRAIDRLTPEEDAAIQDAPIDARERVVISLLRWSGLRVGEACSLNWNDVGADFLRVRTSKTDSGVRNVPMLPELAGELGAWRRYLESEGLYSPTGPVLATNRRTHMKPQFVWRLVKRVSARAGVRVRPAPDASGWNVSEVTDHTFRKTFASDLLNRGLRLEHVSRTLGHSDTRVTQQYYAELQDDVVRDEVLRAMGVAS